MRWEEGWGWKKHGGDERKEENAIVGKKRRNFVAGRRCIAGPANSACEGPTRLRSCNHVCMKYMLLNALRLRRKGVTPRRNFGPDPGSVQSDSWRQRSSLTTFPTQATTYHIPPNMGYATTEPPSEPLHEKATPSPATSVTTNGDVTPRSGQQPLPAAQPPADPHLPTPLLMHVLSFLPPNELACSGRAAFKEAWLQLRQPHQCTATVRQPLYLYYEDVHLRRCPRLHYCPPPAQGGPCRASVLAAVRFDAGAAGWAHVLRTPVSVNVASMQRKGCKYWFIADGCIRLHVRRSADTRIQLGRGTDRHVPVSHAHSGTPSHPRA